MFKKIMAIAIAMTCICMTSIAAPSHSTLPQPVKSVKELNRVIATVNGDPITQHQFSVFYTRAVARLKQQRQMLPDIGEMHRYILDQLIDRRLQLQLAKRNGIKVSEQQINKQIQVIMRQHKMNKAQLKAYLKNLGYTYSQFRDEVRTEIMIGMVQHNALAGRISLSQDQVQAEYNKLKSDPHFAAQYHVIDVLVPLGDNPSSAQVVAAKKTALALKSQLQRGVSYKSLRTNNVDDLGWRTLSEMPTLFASQVKGLKARGVAGPLRAANGYHVIQLLSMKKSASAMPTMQQVQQHLLMQQIQKQMADWLKQLRKQSDVQVYEAPST